MKICITSQGNNLDSQVDPRFGRCQYFIIVDPVTMKFEVVENQNIGAMGGAGIQSAQLIASKGTEIVLTGNVGPNAFQTLQAAGVKVVTGVMGAIREVIEKFRKEEIAAVEGPTVPGHFGMGQGMGRGIGRGMGRGKMSGGLSPLQVQQPQIQQPISEEQELEMLKQQAEMLKQQMEQISKRIDELTKKEENEKIADSNQKAQVDKEKCTGCNNCVDACPEGAIKVDDIAEINEEKCTGCGTCVEECPNEAITLKE